MISINNRRYIGSKAKLVDKIYDEVSLRIKNRITFADIFAGTGVVANKFAEEGHKIIINDILFSNYISYHAWFGKESIDKEKISKIIKRFNSLKYVDIEENYFSESYAGKYYSLNDAKKIGYIREEIEQLKEELNYREYCVLLTSLMYSADKIANTVGHFEHFLKKTPIDSNFKLKNLKTRTFHDSQIFQRDANDLALEISADVVYIDPPYNARQYVNFYHVLENLLTWNKPTEFEGTSMKFKRNHLKSGYSRVIAKKLLAELVDAINASIIVVSYNNTYNAKSTASNNRISENDLVNILEKKGSLTIVELDHKHFNSGKTVFKNHKEKLYICEVKKNE